MKNSLLFVAAVALLAGFAPAFGAPEAKPKAPTKTPTKAVADPLDIPAFAPIPNEFVFAGTQKDVYKLLSGYTGGISLADLPELTDEQRKEIIEKKSLEDYSKFQALLDVKHILAPIHVLRVRSLSYYALGEEGQKEAYEELGAKIIEGDEHANESPQNRGYYRSQELLGNAETFYKNLMVKQGGKVQMQLRGETSITVYAFAQPQTFAVITSGPSRVIVARADGKPDVGAITGIFQRVVGGN